MVLKDEWQWVAVNTLTLWEQLGQKSSRRAEQLRVSNQRPHARCKIQQGCTQGTSVHSYPYTERKTGHQGSGQEPSTRGETRALHIRGKSCPESCCEMFVTEESCVQVPKSRESHGLTPAGALAFSLEIPFVQRLP